jgi:hypothetical protein
MTKKDDGEDVEEEDEDEDENPFVAKDLTGYETGKEADLFGLDVDEVGKIPSSKYLFSLGKSSANVVRLVDTVFRLQLLELKMTKGLVASMAADLHVLSVQVELLRGMMEGFLGVKFSAKGGELCYELQEEMGPLDGRRRLINGKTRAELRAEGREIFTSSKWALGHAFDIERALKASSGGSKVKKSLEKERKWWEAAESVAVNIESMEVVELSESEVEKRKEKIRGKKFAALDEEEDVGVPVDEKEEEKDDEKEEEKEDETMKEDGEV